MKTWHIILKTDKKEEYDYKCSKYEQKLIVPLKEYSEKSCAVRTTVLNLLEKEKLVPSDNAYDLLNIAIGVYAVDQMISRKIDGFQKWSRHFILHIPVHSVTEWNNVKNDFEKLLSFLSGDKWEVIFREQKNRIVPDKELFSNPKGIQVVSLFSGGLDSFIGAVDLLEKGKKVAFVSHYKGGTAEKFSQDELYSILEKAYKKDSFRNLQFFVQPNQDKLSTKEPSSRCRSLLFICLGIAVANSLGNDINLNVPENGFISLNVPLTHTRLSSHSTRTTHPYYMQLFNKILDQLGINNIIFNPYQFCTKGEMIKNCLNQEFFKSNYKKSISCAHPDISRWSGGSPNQPCGYCTPCIIRKAALNKAGLNETGYAVNIRRNPPDVTTAKGRDLRAFKLAIKRFEKMNKFSILMQVLSSGPIPFKSKNVLDDFIGVYSKGLTEVAEFLKN